MKGDKTSTIALVIAGILLLGVGAYSYHDYVKSKLEKEFTEKEKALGQERELLLAQNERMRGAPAAAPPYGGAQNPPPAVSGNPAAAPSVAGAGQMPNVPLPPIPQQLLTTPPAGGANNPADERLAKMEANLAALKRENELYQSTLEAKAKEKGGSAGAGTPAMPNRPAPPAPKPAPGAAPDQQAELDAMAEKVRSAAAIAKVVEYDPDWAFVVIDRGKDGNLKPDDRFAVRRGAEILGFIRITEVNESISIAQLLTRNKYSPTARKPAPGDDVIAANLF